MHILDTEVNGITDKLQLLTVEKRRRIIADACQFASKEIENLEPSMQVILDYFANKGSLSVLQLSEVRILADEADEAYFSLMEGGKEENEYLSWFSKARLLTAILSEFNDSSWIGSADAIYELSKTSDDSTNIIAFIKNELDLVLKSD
jgi:hypothetical protein